MNEELDQTSLNKYDPNRDMVTNWVIKVGQRFKAPWMKDSQAKRSKKKKRKMWLKYNTSGLVVKIQYFGVKH